MLDEKIDVGEADEIETEIDLDAEPAPEQSLEEEVHVEQTTEDDTKSEDTTEESAEQQAVQADEQKAELDEYSEGVQTVIINGKIIVKEGRIIENVFPGKPILSKYKK